MSKENLTISDMKQMQLELYEVNKDKSSGQNKMAFSIPIKSEYFLTGF